MHGINVAKCFVYMCPNVIKYADGIRIRGEIREVAFRGTQLS